MMQSILETQVPDESISHLIYEWTKLYPQNHAAIQSPAAEDKDTWEKFFQDEGIALKRVEASKLSNRRVMQNRRSVRVWEKEALSLDNLAYVLNALMPQEAPQAMQYQGFFQSESVELCKLVCIALNVDGLAQGAYLYDESAASLHPMRLEDPLPFLSKICIQAEFLEAPVILLMASSPAQAMLRYGDRGYRYLLMESGMLLAKAYFVTGSIGLVGSASGSFVFRELENWLGFDGIYQSSSIAFALGNPRIVKESQ